MIRDELTRAEDRLRVLTETMHAFAETTFDEKRLFDVIARRVADTIRDTCALFVLDDTMPRLLPVAGHAAEGVTTKLLDELMVTSLDLTTSPHAREVIETGKTFFVPKMKAAELRTSERRREQVDDMGMHSLLVVALRARGRSIGILSIARVTPSLPPFDDADRELAESLADQAALAMENARAYGRERVVRGAAEESAIQLRASQARFQRLSESGTIGILITHGTRIVEANQALADMIGYSREEIVAGTPPWPTLTAPGYGEVDARALQQLQLNGVAALREKEYIRKDGTLVPALVGSAYIDGGPEAISFLVDLTERRKAQRENALLVSQHAADVIFRGLIEGAPDAMVILDESGRIRLANGQAEKMFGFSGADLLGKPAIELAAVGVRASFSGDVFGATSREFLALRKGGAEFPAEMTVSSFRTDDAVLVTAAIRDVTERKLAEAELLRAKVAVEDANRELEAFSYSVAHDLRAPLRAISGFAGILRETSVDKLDAEGIESIDDINRATKRMAELIDSLLSLSRLTRVRLHVEDVDLSALASEVLNGLRRQSSREVEVVVAPGLVATMDPALGRAVLDNLLGNAWKFTSKTLSPRIEVGVTERNGVATFFVRDNGAGFDMSYAHKLFAPFQRLHRATDFAGTGVGLATVQRIVHRHGGRIEVEASVDHGATFFFTLRGESR